MTKKLFFVLALFTILTAAITPTMFPSVAHAQQNENTGIFGNVCDGPDCDFHDLMQLAENVLQFLVLVSIPLATISFAYAGYLLLTSGGSSEKMSQAKGMFTNVIIGLVIVLSAWLIVRTITSTLLKEGTYEELLG